MACIDGIDPADFQTGILDPASDPAPPATRFDISDGTYFDLASPYVQFEVTTSPVNYAAGVSVLWSTANGTAIAGTHFTGVSNQLLSFAAGEGAKTIQVSVLKPSGVSGTKAFTVNLSGNSAGTTIGDGSGAGTITYSGAPPVSDPADLTSFTGWNRDDAYIYNQFSSCSTCPERCGGCNYYGACTGFAGAALASAHRAKLVGDRQCYDAKQLYTGAGGPGASSSCAGGGWYSTAILDYLAGNTSSRYGGSGLGALLGGTSSTRRKIQSWSQIFDTDKPTLIKKIKRSIYANSVVYMDSIFYSNWNSAGSSSWPHFFLPDNGSGTSTGGHSWVLVGWNNNVDGTGVGAFAIQSSHGGGWANNGRAWIPYSYLKTGGTSPNPWYRYFAAVPKSGG